MAGRETLSALEREGEFVQRHIGPDAAEIEAMLAVVGARSLEDLVKQATPAAIRTERPLALPAPLDERTALTTLRRIAERNRVQVSMIGMGYYDTITPAVILRNVLENPGWYTAYTPYQAEVSQGRLEALLNFQQMVIDLTGLELANASLLDEATAAAEAMAMARRVGKSGANAFFVDVGLPSADARRAADARPRPRPGHRGRRSVPRPAAGPGVRRSAPLPRLERRGARFPAGDRAAARRRRARGHGDRSAQPRRADAARRARRRRGDRQRPALRRADGLRRAARRVLRDARRLQARGARPPDRRVGGCARPPGAAHGAADPRAAHPAREGDQQHLHGAGAARRDGRDVRGLPRPRRSPPDRPAGAPPHPDSGRRPAAIAASR